MSSPPATKNSLAANGVNESCPALQPCLESAGTRLRDARNAQNISEKDAAQKLRLMVTDLRAIEADSYGASVNDDLLRNHLRDYANLLRLNPDSILAIYDRQAGARLHRGANRIDDLPRAKMTSFGSMLTGGLVVMTVVLGVLVVLQFVNVSRLNSLLAENGNSQEAELRQVGDGGSTAAAADDSALPPLAVAGETDVVLAAAEVNLDAAQPQIKSAAVSADPTDDGALTEVAAAYRRDSGAGVAADKAAVEASDELSFRFAKDCWVEVYDADGKRLIAEIRKAGGSLQLSGKSPFKVLVGHSREVVLQFNNQPVDIEKIDRSYSTLFTVGRANNDSEAPLVKTIRRKLPSVTTAPAETAAEHTALES